MQDLESYSSALHPLTFGITVPLFAEKIYRVKGRFFLNKIRLLIVYIFKNEIKEDHSKRSKVI